MNDATLSGNVNGRINDGSWRHVVVHRGGGRRAMSGFASAGRLGLAAGGFAAIASKDPIEQARSATGLASIGTGIDTAARVNLHATAIPLLSTTIGFAAAGYLLAAILRSVEPAEQTATLRAAAGSRIAAGHFRCRTARLAALIGTSRTIAHAEHAVQEFKAKRLAAEAKSEHQGAHDQRKFLHRAISPFRWNCRTGASPSLHFVPFRSPFCIRTLTHWRVRLDFPGLGPVSRGKASGFAGLIRGTRRPRRTGGGRVRFARTGRANPWLELPAPVVPLPERAPKNQSPLGQQEKVSAYFRMGLETSETFLATWFTSTVTWTLT